MTDDAGLRISPELMEQVGLTTAEGEASAPRTTAEQELLHALADAVQDATVGVLPLAEGNSEAQKAAPICSAVGKNKQPSAPFTTVTAAPGTGASTVVMTCPDDAKFFDNAPVDNFVGAGWEELLPDLEPLEEEVWLLTQHHGKMLLLNGPLEEGPPAASPPATATLLETAAVLTANDGSMLRATTTSGDKVSIVYGKVAVHLSAKIERRI
jgi:hypothetical protein